MVVLHTHTLLPAADGQLCLWAAAGGSWRFAPTVRTVNIAAPPFTTGYFSTCRQNDNAQRHIDAVGLLVTTHCSCNPTPFSSAHNTHWKRKCALDSCMVLPASREPWYGQLSALTFGPFKQCKEG